MGTLRDEFVAERPYAADAFQLAAFDAIDAGRNVCVAAPTGSGKTLVAEYALAQAGVAGTKVFYTTPIKALSNQKFRDLTAVHGRDRVGLLTGDNSIRGEAPIVVMTTEVLRNMIHAESPTLDGLGWVILDEVHYLGDRERGAVWEEVIIHLPVDVGLVCLSATIPNADELGDWIETLRGDTDVIVETTRPVSLEERYAVGDRRAERVRLVPMFRNGRPNMEAADFDPRDPRRRGGRFGIPRRAELVEEMDRAAMLPAIVFIFSRDGCETAMAQVRSLVGRLTDESEREAIREIAETYTEGLDDDDLRILGYGAWIDALEAGFAAHHAGIVPPMKEAVEAAFSAGLVKVVFATETLALGINMPARSVVIERLTKFTGSGHEYLTPGEFTQLTGRAGRRGIDDRGFAVVCWSPWTPFAEVAALAASPTSPLRSSFRPTYNTAANLIRRYDRPEAEHLVNASFAQFHADRDVAGLESQLARKRERLATLGTTSRGGAGGGGSRGGRVKSRDSETKASKLEGEIRRLDRRIRRRSHSLVRQFDRVVTVLESWGYAEGWELTDAGGVLAGLSAEMDLLIAESIRTGLLDDLDAADLGALVSCFTYERRARDARVDAPAGAVAERFRGVRALHRDLSGTERDANLQETREPDIGFAATIGSWIRGDGLAAVLDEERAPGDFVRHVKQCVDLLRQIADLGLEPVSGIAGDAAAGCMRGLVEASSAVRE